MAKQEVLTDKRRTKWRGWTSSQEAPALRERQAAHRLAKTVQPRERPDATADPWQLAANCLHHLNLVKQSLGSKWSLQMRALEDLDEAMELVKQLAVGPDSLPEPAPESGPGQRSAQDDVLHPAR